MLDGLSDLGSLLTSLESSGALPFRHSDTTLTPIRDGVRSVIFTTDASEAKSHQVVEFRTTLLSAALTGKVFSEPAMRHLWRVLPSLYPESQKQR